MTKPASVEDYKLTSSYETVRRRLLGLDGDQRLEKPLAYWALPSDRRLPLALLDRTLAELLTHGFDDLSSTPGIGQKKMGAMIKLLLRAAKDATPPVPFGISELAEDEEFEAGESGARHGHFDPEVVSESQFARWKETVQRHQLQDQMLGRLAPALVHLPTVIWRTPLSFYLEKELAEIRALKTHGAKRVAVVLEVFYTIHRMMEQVPRGGSLAIRPAPRIIQSVEDWMFRLCAGESPVDEAEIRSHLVLPLLRQTKLDVGPTVHGLAEGRLGIRGAVQNVRSQSQRMGITRARVYQLLDEAADAMAVRWPQGGCLLRGLSEKLAAAGVGPADRRLLDAARNLYFPERQQQRDET